MNLSELFKCCWNEQFVDRENKLLLVYTDKLLNHYQKCVIDEKTPAKIVCETISKTEDLLLKGKFSKSQTQSPNTNQLNQGRMILVLICRQNFLRFSTRVLNFFELPLQIKHMKPSETEYLFVVMRQNEIKSNDSQKIYPKFEISSLTNLLEKGKILFFAFFILIRETL